jgi:hypothetical protein
MPAAFDEFRSGPKHRKWAVGLALLFFLFGCRYFLPNLMGLVIITAVSTIHIIHHLYNKPKSKQ